MPMAEPLLGEEVIRLLLPTLRSAGCSLIDFGGEMARRPGLAGMGRSIGNALVSTGDPPKFIDTGGTIRRSPAGVARASIATAKLVLVMPR